jgi:RNA polymerase sigma factor (sigma-70 family)
MAYDMDQKTTFINPISDDVLIRKILSGEKRLFEHIMRSYNQRLYRIGMSILNNDMETEDAMQTAYINAYEHLSSFEERSSFGTWLTRIMVNECLAQKKKKKRFKMEIEKQPGNFINMRTPAFVLANKELSGVLENAVGQLPEKYRLVFVLREIEEMSVRQTSETLSIEESNVKARLSRAKMMLRENLNGFMKENVYSFHLTRCNRIVSNVLTHLNI